MFDIKWIRDNPDAFDAGLKRRGIAPGGDDLRPIRVVGIAPTFRRQVEIVVPTEYGVEPSRVGGIGMEDLAVPILVKHADAGQFLAVVAGINGDRPEIIGDPAFGDLVLRKRHVKVEIESLP